MYSVTKSIYIDFAHHVRGHLGACVNLHGHTWAFQATIVAHALDNQGFVVDFSDLKSKCLQPVHDLLDHSLALGDESYEEVKEAIIHVGSAFNNSRQKVHGEKGFAAIPPRYYKMPGERISKLNGAFNIFPGGMKIAIFPFTPTSERLAEWFHGVCQNEIAAPLRWTEEVRVYETLHPVEAYASYKK
jgi:6-pyruvoyl-tetrahydropterin synthase